jgi:hypothetical protein
MAFGLVTAGLPDIATVAVLVAATYPGVAAAIFVALESSRGRCPTRSFAAFFPMLFVTLFAPLFVAFFPTFLLMTLFFSLFMTLFWASERARRDRESEE